MTQIMEEFQHKMNFEKEKIQKNHKNLPAEFEMDRTFLSSLIFRDNNYDMELTIDGKLWLREQFMKA